MKKITDFSQLDLTKQYTYADYLTWQFSERVELIKGWLYKMSPAPKRIHQEVEGNIYFKLRSHFLKNNCRIYQSPFDVRLIKNKGQKDNEITTVVQPDISVICDQEKLDDAGCLGAPDLIVEVLSDSTAKKDYNDKFNLYEENQVKEYWIVNPVSFTIEIYTLKDNTYQLHGLFDKKSNDDFAAGQLFPDLKVALKEVFAE